MAESVEWEGVVVRPTEVVEALAVVAAQRAAEVAEVAARRPAGSQTAAPMEETVVQLPIPAGPFAESTSSPSYSSTQ